MSGFVLDPRLQGDTYLIGDLPLSRVLLMNDQRYQWVILVPRLVGASELIDLGQDQQQQLWQESAMVSRAMQAGWPGDKLNVAALGNIVPQLHLHHVMRSKDDPAWPGPVWGHSSAQAYTQPELEATLSAWRQHLGL